MNDPRHGLTFDIINAFTSFNILFKKNSDCEDCWYKIANQI